jgi:hypothetical protein
MKLYVSLRHKEKQKLNDRTRRSTEKAIYENLRLLYFYLINTDEEENQNMVSGVAKEIYKIIQENSNEEKDFNEF